MEISIFAGCFRTSSVIETMGLNYEKKLDS